MVVPTTVTQPLWKPSQGPSVRRTQTKPAPRFRSTRLSWAYALAMPRMGRKASSTTAGIAPPTIAAMAPMPMPMLKVGAVFDMAMIAPSTGPSTWRKPVAGASPPGRPARSSPASPPRAALSMRVPPCTGRRPEVPGDRARRVGKMKLPRRGYVNSVHVTRISPGPGGGTGRRRSDSGRAASTTQRERPGHRRAQAPDRDQDGPGALLRLDRGHGAAAHRRARRGGAFGAPARRRPRREPDGDLPVLRHHGRPAPGAGRPVDRHRHRRVRTRYGLAGRPDR